MQNKKHTEIIPSNITIESTKIESYQNNKPKRFRGGDRNNLIYLSSGAALSMR